MDPMIHMRSTDSTIIAQGSAFSNNIGSVQVRGGLHIHHAGNLDDSVRNQAEEWLRSISPDFFAFHEKARDLHRLGTGSRFIQSATFQQWCSVDSGVRHLACVGMPGAGKTVMASLVIDYLKKHHEDDKSITLFAYIRDDQRTMHTVPHILAGFLLQLLRRQPEASNSLISLYKDFSSRGGQIPTLQRFTETLKEDLSSFSSVFVVLDALDEWNPANPIPNTNHDLVQELEDLPHARLLVTSRHSIPFSSPNVFVDLPIHAASEDLRTYIDFRMRRGLMRRFRASEKVKGEILTKVEEKAKGMFIMARFLVDRIEHCPTLSDLREELETIPSDLRELYRMAFERIRRHHQADFYFASMLFSWMVYAKERLTAEEVLHGIAACSKSLRNTVCDGVPDIDHLIMICGGLISLNEEENVYPRTGRATYFVFVHFTIKEFLVESATTFLPRAEINMAEACLRYLSFALPLLPEDVSSHMIQSNCDICRSDEMFKLLQSFPLFNYAAVFWCSHACPQGDSDHIDHNLALELYCHPLSPYMIHYNKKIAVEPTTTPDAYFVLLLASSGLLCLLKTQSSDTLTNFCEAEGRSALSFAAEKGHSSVIQHLLECGPDYRNAQHVTVNGTVITIDSASRTGMTPLHYATQNGQVEAMRLLLDRGADVGRADGYGRTPFTQAPGDEKVDVMRLLLDRGAGIDEADESGETRLSRAASMGRIDVMQLLLERGADVHRANKQGRTPLFDAAAAGHTTAIQLLIDRGADVDKVNVKGCTPLFFAAGSGREEAVRLLISRGAKVDRVDKAGRTALFNAANVGKVSVMQLLLDRGAHADTVNKDGRTPLSSAALAGRVAAIQLLIDRGAGLNRGDKGGRTPLSLVAEFGFVDAAELLLDKGAEVDRADQRGRTPLSWAAEYGFMGAARLLLDRGARVNKAEFCGRTPLSWAANFGHICTMRLLLDRGAIVDRADKNRWTPLSLEATKGQVPAMRLLLNKGANGLMANGSGRTPLSISAGEGSQDAVKLLLDRGFEVDKADKCGRTPLGWAAQGGHVEAGQALLDGGAQLDNAEKNGRTPLSLAAGYERIDVMKLLLDKGAEVDRTDGCGRTPLHWAANNSSVASVELLLERGADPNRVDNDGKTPLSHAAGERRKGVVKLLLDRGADPDRGRKAYFPHPSALRHALMLINPQPGL